MAIWPDLLIDFFDFLGLFISICTVKKHLNTKRTIYTVNSRTLRLLWQLPPCPPSNFGPQKGIFTFWGPPRVGPYLCHVILYLKKKPEKNCHLPKRALKISASLQLCLISSYIYQMLLTKNCEKLWNLTFSNIFFTYQELVPFWRAPVG